MREKPSYDMTIIRGDTKSVTLTLKNEDGTPKSLVGYVAEMQIRDKHGGKIYASLSSPSNGITVTGYGGKIRIDISSEVSAGFNFNKAKYDIRVYEAGTTDYNYILHGDFFVRENITE